MLWLTVLPPRPPPEVIKAALTPQAVLFDCDGVLVDSETITSRVWAGLLTEIGLPTTTEQSLATYLGNSMLRCLEIVKDQLGAEPPPHLLPMFHERVNAALAREVEAVEGVVDLLDQLDSHAIPYAVVSNGDPDKMRTTLGKTGLLSRFDGRCYSAAVMGRPKPAPDIFLLAAEELGVRAEYVTVIEDSPLGVEGASMAGMTVVGFASLVAPSRLKKSGAHYTAASMREIGELLGLDY